MRIEELLELAALDAFGLLDEFESELYTRSFHHAPVAVQDEILRIQAELAADESLLPAEMPTTALRQRVLDAVARAIEEDARELAPLASIGQRFAITSGGAVSRTRITLSGQFWRAAALVMIVVSIVLAYFGAEARNEGNRIAKLALDAHTMDQLERLIGPGFMEFVGHPNCRSVLFRNRAPGTDMVAALYINEQTEKAFLYVMGMRNRKSNPQLAEQTYTLTAVLSDGTPLIVETFNNNDIIAGVRIDQMSATLMTAVRWEISDATQTVILSTA